MKEHSMAITGKVSDSGMLMITNKSEMEAFFKKWSGVRVIMKVDVYPEAGSELLQGYYFKKIVPDFQNIFREKDGERMSLEAVDLKLRGMCPVMFEEIPKEESGGFDLERVKTVYEVSSSQLVEFVEHVRWIASMEYDYFIEDPRRM